jgi:hypothetical protein
MINASCCMIDVDHMIDGDYMIGLVCMISTEVNAR